MNMAIFCARLALLLEYANYYIPRIVGISVVVLLVAMLAGAIVCKQKG